MLVPDRSELFVQLVTQYQQRVHLFILSLVPNRTDAEEILQETNLVLWRRFEEFRPGSDFRAWAFQVAFNKVKLFHERHGRDKLHFGAEVTDRLATIATSAPDSLPAELEALERLQDATQPAGPRPDRAPLPAGGDHHFGGGRGGPQRGGRLQGRGADSPHTVRVHPTSRPPGGAKMTLSPSQQLELRDLVDALCEDGLTPATLERLESLLLADDDACRYYLNYLSLHGALLLANQNPQPEIPNPSRHVPPIILDLSPTFRSPLMSLHSPVGGFVFSYLVGALLLGIGLLIGWTWRIHYDQQVVQNAPPQSPVFGESKAERESVGRITGLVDCRRADGSTETFDRAHVPLGSRYALATGFMEITYDTGAKVILQGPCTYEVESAAGGFLSLGKLTARVEKRGEEPRDIINPRSATSNLPRPSPLSPLPSFRSVRPPPS